MLRPIAERLCREAVDIACPERVDVPVRLEKRLAALLRDLAEHKGMSLNSCLEETLLHTFNQVGDASPARTPR